MKFIVLTSYKKRILVPIDSLAVEETASGTTVRVGLSEFRVSESLQDIESLLMAADSEIFELPELVEEPAEEVTEESAMK